MTKTYPENERSIEKPLFAEEIAETVDAMSARIMEDIVAPFRAAVEDSEKQALALKAGQVSANAIGSLASLMSVSLDGQGQYAELPEDDQTTELLDTLVRTASRIAGVQQLENSNERVVISETDAPASKVIKCVILGGQKPVDSTKALINFDASVEQAHTAHALIKKLAEQNPDLTSTGRFNLLTAASLALLIEE